MRTKKSPQPRRRRKEQTSPAQQLAERLEKVLKNSISEQTKYREQVLILLKNIDDTLDRRLQRLAEVAEGI